MLDSEMNYWKEKYRQQWDISNEKEQLMREYIFRETGKESEFSGFGAGCADFIDGEAERYGHEKADADLHVLGTDIYVEVTGPMNWRVGVTAPLWFRPDKIQTAIGCMNEKITFLCHYLPSSDLWRVVHVNSWFAERYRNGRYRTVRPVINGCGEKYVEIKANDPAVRDIGYLMCSIMYFSHRQPEAV